MQGRLLLLVVLKQLFILFHCALCWSVIYMNMSHNGSTFIVT